MATSLGLGQRAAILTNELNKQIQPLLRKKIEPLGNRCLGGIELHQEA